MSSLGHSNHRARALEVAWEWPRLRCAGSAFSLCCLLLVALLWPGTLRAEDRSGIRPSVLQMPAGPGSMEGLGEGFEANPNSGTSSYAIPIEVPPGTAGFAPELELVYSSGAGNSVLGLGWSLALPAVQRGTDRRLPVYDRTDIMVLKGMGGAGAEELVELPDGSWRFRIEGAFARGRWREDGSWSFRSKSGILHRFGASEHSRVEHQDRTFSWALTEQVDTHDNKIRYEYFGDAGQVYLERVVYNDFAPEVRNEILFEYEARADALTSTVSGFPVTTALRLARVLVLHGGEVQRRYELAYDEVVGTSHLTRVRLVGRDGRTAMPALSFDYTAFEPEAEVLPIANAPARAVGRDAELSDVNGDGLPDLVVMDPSSHGGAYHWYENRDGQRFLPGEPMASTPSVWLDSGDMELSDMSGDGITDVVARVSSATDGLRYYPGSPERTFTTAVVVQGAEHFTPGSSRAKLVDLNRDRLNDVLTIDPTTGRMTAAFNQGEGVFSAPEALDVPWGHELLSFESGLTLADMNGDGLMDLVLARSESVRYWPGLGYGRFGPAQALGAPPKLEEPELAGLQVRDLNGDGLSDLVSVGVTEVSYWLNRAGLELSEREHIEDTPYNGPDTEVRIADMNANGSDDIVWIDPTAEKPWQFLDVLPRGTPGLLERIDNGLGHVTRISYAGLGEMRARAREASDEWTERCPMGMTLVSAIDHDDTLGSVTRSEYRYSSGYFDAAQREFRGFGAVTVREVGDASEPTLDTHHWFHLGQDDEALKGLPYRTERAAAEGLMFDQVFSEYDVRTLDSAADATPVRYAAKVRKTRWIHELTSDPVAIVSEFEEDEFGNVVVEANYGVVDGQDLGAGDDEAIVQRRFATNPELWIVDRVASERTENLDGNRVSETRYHYDGEAFEGLPLGEVTRGDVTRKTSFIDEARGFVDDQRTRFDRFGNAIETLDARGLRTVSEFDAQSHTHLVAERKYPSEGTELAWIAEYDRGFGKVARVSGPNGEQHQFAYDPLARLAKVVEPGDSLALPTKQYLYELGTPLSILREEQREHFGKEGTLSRIAYFDGRGRRRAELEEGPEDGRWVVKSATLYGARGQEVFSASPSFQQGAAFPEMSDLAGIHLEYDALGRELLKTEPDGSEVRTEYGVLQKTVWDENDSDPGSAHHDTPTTYRTDGLERLVEVLEREGDQLLVTGVYQYNALGKVTRVVDANGHSRSYRYDGRSRRSWLSDPNAGEWRFAYSEGNDLIEQRDPTGRIVRFEHDFAGRPLTEAHQLPGEPETIVKRYHYDTPTEAFPQATQLLGQLAWVDDEAGELFFSYSARGLQTEQLRRWSDGTEHRTRTRFDAANRPIERTFPDGTSYQTQHDRRGLVSSVGPFASHVTWTAAAQLEALELANGVTEKRRYDDRQRLTRMTARGPLETIRDLSIEYDGASLVRSLDDARAHADPTLSLSARFSYDDRYRLIEAEDPVGTTQWTHDPMANLLSVTSSHDAPHLNVDNRFGQEDAGPDALTQFGDQRLTYDAAGRLLSDGERTLTWDAKGRLSQVERGTTVEHYTYSFDDERAVKVTTNSGGAKAVRYIAPDVEERNGSLVRYAFVGDERLVRLDALPGEEPMAMQVDATVPPLGPERPLDPRWLLLGLLGLGVVVLGAERVELLPRRRRWVLPLSVGFACASATFGCQPRHGGEPSVPTRLLDSLPAATIFYTLDYQGTPVALTNARGEVIERSARHPYGSVRARSGDTREPYGYVGNEVDADVGLSDFNARPYLPQAGVFLKPDPVAVFQVEEALEKPHMLWAFAYAEAAPVTWRDPTGLCKECEAPSTPAGGGSVLGEFEVTGTYPGEASSVVIPPAPPPLRLADPNAGRPPQLAPILPTFHVGLGGNFLVPLASFLTPLTGGIGGGGIGYGAFVDFSRGSVGLYERKDVRIGVGGFVGVGGEVGLTLDSNSFAGGGQAGFFEVGKGAKVGGETGGSLGSGYSFSASRGYGYGIAVGGMLTKTTILREWSLF